MSVPSLSLEGKVAIVTGGSRGIGRAIALAFAGAGADVVVCSRDLDGKLGMVAEEIKGLGQRSLAVPTDVMQKAALDNLVQKTMAEFGAIDILVNNAGTSVRKSVLEHTDEDWDKVMDTNLTSYFLCSRAVAKIMTGQKRGNIISIASVRGLQGASGRVSYNVSKAGVIMLTRCLALEFASDNIFRYSRIPWREIVLTSAAWKGLGGRRPEIFFLHIDPMKNLCSVRLRPRLPGYRHPGSVVATI